MKKFAALLLALTMVLGMATITASAEGSERVITIGTTWDLYWDSFDGSIEDNPYYSGTTADEMKFAKVKQIEEKWGVKFEYINLTYAGAKESINTSVLAGTPDVDVYMMDLALAAPAAANGYVIDMRDVLPADNTVIQGKDAVLSYIDTGSGAVQLLCDNNAENMVGSTMPLAFNLQMIEDANLEDPRDLVERGEWTWEKFREYCKTLTKDTDGDGNIDVYGFGGWPGDYFMNLVMSNGTNVAATATENLSSPEVGEVLQFMQDLNLVDKVMFRSRKKTDGTSAGSCIATARLPSPPLLRGLWTPTRTMRSSLPTARPLISTWCLSRGPLARTAMRKPTLRR